MKSKLDEIKTKRNQLKQRNKYDSHSSVTSNPWGQYQKIDFSTLDNQDTLKNSEQTGTKESIEEIIMVTPQGIARDNDTLQF